MGEPRRCWLRWHNYSDTVTSALESLRYDEDFLDVTVACEGHTIRAHKLVLSACSAYFRKVLKDHPCDHPIIILDGLGWREMVALLHFMYCGEVVIEENQLPNLLNAALNLSVTGLTHVTTALASTEASVEDDSEEEDFEEDEEDEELEDLKNADNQKSKRDVENDGDSSRDSDAPPAKRPRPDSLDTLPGSWSSRQAMEESVKERRESAESIPVTSASGDTSYKQEVHAATPHTFPPITDTSRNKENEKKPANLTKPNDKEVKSISVKMVNGDCHIKEEMEDLEEVEAMAEAMDSSCPENGDSDSLRAPVSLSATNSGDDSMNESLMDDSALPGASPSLGAVNYASLLAAGSLLPISSSSKPTTTILLSPPVLASTAVSEGTINMEKMVQQVLFPSLPTTGTLPTTVTPLAADPVATTASSTTLSTTTSLVSTCSGQPYIHPSLVSIKEVQATLEQYQRKLAFHEPRPCPTCKRMYRDAATLRTHMAIMHAEGKEPFSCSCGALFRTKYDMYQHKKNGHR